VLEGERSGSMGGRSCPSDVGIWNLDGSSPAYGLERQLLEAERRIDREVGESPEVVANFVRERAGGRRLNHASLRIRSSSTAPT
jgi:hypothetical protein